MDYTTSYHSEHANFIPVSHKVTLGTVLNDNELIPPKWLHSQSVSRSEISVVTRHRGCVGDKFLVGNSSRYTTEMIL